MQAYDFSNIEHIAKFDSDLDTYSKNRGVFLDKIKLTECFTYIYPEYPNLFYSILDLKLNLVVLYCDTVSMLKCQTRNSPDETFEFFRYLSSFITRYRTIYEKFMWIIISIGYPKRLKDFKRSNSKLGTFIKIIKKQPSFQLPNGSYYIFDSSFLDWFFDYVQIINSFRTPELHNNGSLRTWIFSGQKLEETNFDKLFVTTANILTTMDIISSICKGFSKINNY